MSEVSCKAFEILSRPFAARGIEFSEIIKGTSLTVAQLQNKKELISWRDYCAVMRNVRPYFTDEEYIELGRSYMRLPTVRFAFVIARLVFSPLQFYRWFNKPREGVGNQMFRCIVPSLREVSSTELELELLLPEGHEVCWDFFLITSGNMEELPRLFGLPRAKMKLTRLPRGARMELTLPTARVPLLVRIWRFLLWPFTARAAARELVEAHETLAERYSQLQDARTKLDRQATQLRTAHKINELAQRSLELEHMLETITNALVHDAGFAWAELALREPARVARAGDAGHEPLTRTLTTRAGQVIGEVTVAPATDADRSEREELLEFIVPGIAIALENAIYRTGLEHIVDERTTELRLARDQLAGTVDQLRQVQGSRERFFGNISHEIRTPLSIIMLATSNIEARSAHLVDARTRAGFGVVTDAARKLVRLVDELLLLAAGQEGKLETHPEPTDLAALLRQLEAAWGPAAERAGLVLVTRVPATLIASVDPVAIERVATNLVSNAVKYTPRGGTVELELVADEDSLRLSVLDTGPGIDPELAGRLFGRFERGKDRREAGTGIGLSLAKQLVDAHMGKLEVVPRPTGGAHLRVVLPASLVLREASTARGMQLRLVDGSSTPPPIDAGARLTPDGVSRGTILIAEDDQRLAEMIAHLLADEFTVVVAHDGLAALELIKREQPQLLVTDVDMPRIDGIELSRRFREHTGDRLAPIIMLSAMLDLGTRVAGLEAGAVDYINKPFDPLELKARVRAQFRMRELAMRLQRAEQLSALGILTSGLAHELRNPANGIVNAIHPLRELIPRELMHATHPVRQLFDVVAECADAINHLSRQLLGFRNSGMELEKRPAYLHELVERALALTQDAAAGVELDSSRVAGDVALNCAPPMLVQALVNLIENAAYAAGRGGRVDIASRVADGRILIDVGDSGPGVPVELRERVFEPFFTTKPAGVGTGLGLSLARDIIHRHAGTLEIHERGTGTAFVIALPQLAADVAATG